MRQSLASADHYGFRISNWPDDLARRNRGRISAVSEEKLVGGHITLDAMCLQVLVPYDEA
jgi:hypothetical protein